MVYKFRSLREPGLKVEIRDTDGDEVTVNFESINGPSGGQIGIFETEETKIAESMLKDKRNGVIYMDSNYLSRPVPQAEKPKAKKKSTESAPKTPATSEKPKKRKSKSKK